MIGTWQEIAISGLILALAGVLLARALIKDPAGESYIIGEGARVGKNAGFVKQIQDGQVVVTETYVDYMGQETTKDIEMRMRRNEGG